MSSRRHFSTWSLPRRAAFGASVAFGPALLVLALLAPRARAAEGPTVEQMLSAYRPMRPDVEIETPPRSEWSKCKKQVEVHGKTSGWVVLGPAGQVLRRFVDSDGDHTVDQWRYYNHGLEVYRDIDTNRQPQARRAPLAEYRRIAVGGRLEGRRQHRFLESSLARGGHPRGDLRHAATGRKTAGERARYPRRTEDDRRGRPLMPRRLWTR